MLHGIGSWMNLITLLSLGAFFEDVEKKAIHIEGYLKDVVAARKRLNHIVEQIASASGNMSLRVEIPTYWKNFR